MIEALAQRAKQAAILTASLSRQTKDDALAAVARALRDRQDQIIQANQNDLRRAENEQLAKPLLKRLRFDQAKLDDAIAGIQSLIKLDDPVGRTLNALELDAGLELYRVACPIGVLGIVFESRPDALVQISTLALKSGNAVLLKGGSEASETNRILADIIEQASVHAQVPPGWIALLETRQDVKAMLALDQYIDLIIPRGSNAFVRFIMDNTRIPVLGHADGICHLYIDRDADLAKARRIALDAKCQYAAVCNALETLLVDAAIAATFLPTIQQTYQQANVQLRGDARTVQIIDCAPATDQDWRTEYNDLILSVKIVDDLDDALTHINTFGSRHTDAIVTENKDTAQRFMSLVDSANVFWNCSTRFADGFRYGLGAEVGISTNKIHARGPVGLDGLTTYKWKLLGTDHVVADYAKGNMSFTHRPLDKKCPL